MIDDANKIQRYKYPRTPHLPWSPGVGGDDICADAFDHWRGQEVVVTEKLDGENTTLYRDYLHARSIDGRHHPSRDWVKGLHAGIAYLIPDGWRLCGENLYARHTIPYEGLAGYFYLFSIWNEANRCLSWSKTEAWAAKLSLPTPPLLYRGPWDERQIRAIRIDEARMEGYVVRLAEEFAFADFARSVAKWVRPHHVQTDEHWMHGPIIPNRLG